MFATITLLAVAGTLLAIVAHYFAFGPRHREVEQLPLEVRRFSWWSVGLHLVVVAAFLALAGTGAIAVARSSSLTGLALALHLSAAPVFAVAFTLVFVTWAEACRFAGHDWEWAKRAGGYLGGRQDVPAGRFNAGQKAFFWAVGLLALLVILSGLGRLAPVFDDAGQAVLYQVHRCAALLLILSFLVHLYLATLANPGTLAAMIVGKVSADWAKHHHPLWRKQTEGDGPNEE